MKKILLLILIFIASFLFFSKIHGLQSGQQVVKQTIRTTASAKPTPHVTQSAQIGIPTTISIPSIGVNAAVEQVGLDAQGRMGIPQDAANAAWYKYGYKPGEKGSAVIDGHFDTVTGAPAVFYNISQLKIGDTITTTDELHNTYVFKVTNVTSYPYNELPMQQIFATNDIGRLNLITCDGTWNTSSHNYSNRAVVYSVLTATQ